MEEFSNRKTHLLLIAVIAVLAVLLFFTFVIAVIALSVGGKAYDMANGSSRGSGNSAVAPSVITSLQTTPPTGYYSLGSTIVANWNTNLPPLSFARRFVSLFSKEIFLIFFDYLVITQPQRWVMGFILLVELVLMEKVAIPLRMLPKCILP